MLPYHLCSHIMLTWRQYSLKLLTSSMKLFLKITHLKSQPHLPGDNESSFRVASSFLMSYFISVASVHTFPLFLFSPLTYVSQANHIPSLDSVSVELIRSNDVSQSQLFSDWGVGHDSSQGSQGDAVSHVWGGFHHTHSELTPLRAKFFRGSINIYLHFVSNLHIDTTQVVEILPQIRQESTYST